MPDEKKPLSKEQIEVYEVIFKMAMQFILIVAGLVAFFIILHYLIKEKNFNNKLVYAGFNLLLSGTIFLVYRFYFSKDKKKATPKKRS